MADAAAVAACQRLWAERARPKAGGAANIRASILQVNGVLYVATPDNAWGVDARDGHELWHYFWKTRGARISATAAWACGATGCTSKRRTITSCVSTRRTGKERWHKEIANFNQQYFSTMAPVVIGNHILIGTGNDLDEPGYIQSRDPETGDIQWTFHTVPMEKGDPALATWGSLDGARHGAGNVWIPGVYDPDTHLYIVGTGNPSPAYTNPPSRAGDNLYTCSMVAINVDTGKLAWYYQFSPHETHDWDSTETPVLIDAPFNGKMRKWCCMRTATGTSTCSIG